MTPRSDMDLRHSAGTALMLMGLATAAGAQQQHTVDVSRLPIDLERIQRGLRESAVREEDGSGLRLRYIINVFGRAPQIVIISPDANLMRGPVPHSAPTHEQMVEQVTPKEFSAPVIDFTALIRWLADRND